MTSDESDVKLHRQDAEGAKEKKSFTAKDAKENNSFTAKAAKETKEKEKLYREGREGHEGNNNKKIKSKSRGPRRNRAKGGIQGALPVPAILAKSDFSGTSSPTEYPVPDLA